MQNMNGRSMLLLFLALAFLAFGCVSKSEHEGLRQQYEQLAAEKKIAAEDCEQKTSDMTQQLTALDAQKGQLAQQVAELGKEKEDLLASGKAAEEMREQMIVRLQEELENREATIRQIRDTLKIEVVEKLLFDSGSTQISSRGAKVLAKIAPVLLAATDKEILVVGHADDLPPSSRLAKKYPSNWELSAARAAAIVHVLIWGHHLPPERMMIGGAAHYHPLAVFDKDMDKYRRSNRVVEIILKPKGKE